MRIRRERPCVCAGIFFYTVGDMTAAVPPRTVAPASVAHSAAAARTLAPIDLAGHPILGDEVYARIGAAILDGTLPAGERLRDVDLAAQLGVSRTPVREALQRLERFGLVEVAVGRYTRVSQPDLQLRKDTGEFTAYLMGNALRLALGRCTDESLAKMLSDLDEVVDAARRGDPLALFTTSTVFFEGVTRATGNTLFIGFVREAALAIERNLRGWGPFLSVPLRHAEDYARLRACVAARDGDGAERTLRVIHGAV